MITIFSFIRHCERLKGARQSRAVLDKVDCFALLGKMTDETGCLYISK